MYYTYVLRSLKTGIRYVGSSEDVEARLRRHNYGKVKFTRNHKPWKLVYSERYDSRAEAYKRELFLKSGQGRKYLDNIGA
jgi:putative endonuclease